MKTKKGKTQAATEDQAQRVALLNALPDTLIEATGDGVILNFIPSPNARPPFDAPQSVRGNIRDFLPPQICTAILYGIHRAFESRELQAFEFHLPEGSGVRGYEVRVSLCTEHSALIVVRDVTFPKHLERERENLIHELEVKNEESETLRESLAGLVGSLEISQIIENILDQIKKVVPYDSASIWRIEGQVQRLVAGRNLPTELALGEYTIEINDENTAAPVLKGEMPYALHLNVQSDLKDFQDPPHNYINSWLGIPLKTRGQVIGLIALDGREKNQFTQHHADLAVIFANQVAIAVENSRLFSDLQTQLTERTQVETNLRQREAMLEAVTFAAEQFLTPGNWRDVIGRVLERLGKAINATHAYLFENSKSADGVELATLFHEWTALGFPTTDQIEGFSITHEISVIPGGINESLLHGESYSGNIHTFSEVDKARFGSAGLKSLAEFPLMVDGRWWGTIGFDSFADVREWTRFEVDTLSVAGNLLSNAIRRQRDEQALQTELMERKLIEAELRQRDSILEVVADAANVLLKSPNWRDEIDTILGRLGQTINATHAYLFEDHLGADGELLTSMRYEWTAPGYPSELALGLYQNSLVQQEGFEEQVAMLGKGEARVGTTSTFNPIEKDLMDAAGIKSILEVPIFVEEAEWGAVGFNDFRVEREWHSVEVDALKIAANILGAAIKRQLDEHALQVELLDRKQITLDLQQREVILEVVAEAANLFLKSSDWRDEIDFVLEKIGTTINASHAFVFENHELEDGNIVSSMQFEWTAASLPSDLDDPAYQNIPVKEDDFEDWYDCMTAGQPYVGDVKHLDQTEINILLERGMKALLDVPIYVDGTWWGTIGFDDMIVSREWTSAEVGALLVAGNILGAAIQRQQAYMKLKEELSQRKQAEMRLRERESMLEAVTDAANRFLQASDWRTEIDAVLERLGKTLNTSHAYLFEKHPDGTGIILNSLRYEWTAPGQLADIHNPIYQNAEVHESGFERYYAILESGEPFVGNSSFYTESEKELMQASRIKALLEMRIVVDGQQWGTIGFDEMVNEREWSPLEVDVIRVAANVLGAAIKRQEDDASLQAELSKRRALIDELESKNSELERFTYTVSHDLKSPLFTIRGFLGYLEQDALSGDRERLKNDIQRIVDATDKMQQLLNDLLELSRIGRLMNEPRKIELQTLVQEVLGLLHGQIEERGVNIQIHDNLPDVYGDRQRIMEVIQNLVDNGIKFMGGQPKPSIEIGAVGESEDMPTLFVRDNGIGIQQEHFERIFGLFNKLDVKSEGTGIGLALVKRIIEFHGGRIWLDSTPGTGTTFYFTLRRAGDA